MEVWTRARFGSGDSDASSLVPRAPPRGRARRSQADLIPFEQRFGCVICSHIELLAFIVEEWPWFTLGDMFGRAQGVGLSSSSLSVIYRYLYLDLTVTSIDAKSGMYRYL